MSKVRVLILSIVFCLAFSTAMGDDEADLEEAFESIIKCMNAQKMDCFLAGWHPQAVLFTRDYLFSVDRSEAGPRIWKEIFEDFFDTSVEADLILVDVNYRIIDNVGLVWGLTQFVVESETQDTTNQNTRLSAIFKKTGEKWQIVSWHGSAPPVR